MSQSLSLILVNGTATTELHEKLEAHTELQNTKYASYLETASQISLANER